MAYFSLHAYDADVWVREFKGLNQVDENLSGDIRYATEAKNVETPNGVLQPHAGYRVMEYSFDNDRVETIARFHRRWYDQSGRKDWLVCAAGGKLYQRQVEGPPEWDEIPMPSGISSFQSNVWSWVSYEIPNESQPDAPPIDVLLMSNEKDGMIMVIPPDRQVIFNDIKTQTFNDLKTMTFLEILSPRWQIQAVDTQGYKFGVIERYAERIWGGAIAGEPDLLVYSASYDPTDWEPNEEIPEDGAGEISQPSWDGDSFTALRAFGNQLLAFKGERIWRVMGTNPGEYTFSEQYGGGTNYPATIAVDVERVLMAGRDGLSVYDGMSTAPYLRDQIKEIWKMVNLAALDQMSAAMFCRRYYLSFPINGSPVNNAMLVVNQDDGTVLFYDDMTIEAFLPTVDILYATSSSLPGRVVVMRYNSWDVRESSGAATRWVSPWVDFGYKRIIKGGFDLYFVPEVRDQAVTLRFRIQTEKKIKTKTYTVQPLTAEQIARSREHKGKRLHFSGNGRRFRFIIETDAGTTAPWRLIGGLQMVVETDPD